jgi:hydrogenase-4 component F
MLFLIIVAAAAALVSLVAPRRLVELLAIGATLAELAISLWLGSRVLAAGRVIELGGWLAADGLSVVVVLITAGIGAAAAAYSVTYLREDMRERDLDRGTGLADVRRYYALIHLFLLTMFVVSLANNLGLLWVAIEGATLASLFLVSFYRTREALEAAWKYVVVGSVGIALALFGTVLVYAAAVPVLGVTYDMNWTTLATVAPRLDGSVMLLAFLFLLVGYGTKSALAPMHTWVPDAYSEAPSPVSALVGGILVNGGMYGILRFYSIAAPSAGRPALDAMLLGFGLLSLVVGTLFVLRQTDYKRLLAYSSVEQMGLVSIAVAFGGPLGLYAAVLQMLGHALAKSLMFFASGHVLLRYETREVEHVSGVMRALPYSGVALVLGALALAGAPPFGLFSSEIALVTAGVRGGFGPAAVVVVGCLGLVFIAIVGMANHMAFGRLPSDVRRGERAGLRMVPLAAGGAALLVLGVMVPGPLDQLIRAAVATLGGGAS